MGFLLFLLLSVISGATFAVAQSPSEPGLLFYLSGDQGFSADYAAGGNPTPNFLKDVRSEYVGPARYLVPRLPMPIISFEVEIVLVQERVPIRVAVHD